MNLFWKKNLMIFAIYLIAFIGVFLFVLNPTLVNLNRNKQAFTDKNEEFDAKIAKLGSLQKIDRDREGFDKIAKAVDGYLPLTLSSSQFIVEIEGLAQNLGITIESISMSESQPNPGVKKKNSTKNNISETKFTITSRTPYAKAEEFIEQMEKLSRFNSISSLDLNSANADEVNMKLSGIIYYGQ